MGGEDDSLASMMGGEDPNSLGEDDSLVAGETNAARVSAPPFGAARFSLSSARREYAAALRAAAAMETRDERIGRRATSESSSPSEFGSSPSEFGSSPPIMLASAESAHARGMRHGTPGCSFREVPRAGRVGGTGNRAGNRRGAGPAKRASALARGSKPEEPEEAEDGISRPRERECAGKGVGGRKRWQDTIINGRRPRVQVDQGGGLLLDCGTNKGGSNKEAIMMTKLDPYLVTRVTNGKDINVCVRMTSFTLRCEHLLKLERYRED